MSEIVDQVEIHVKGGDGGDGMATFRREKYVPRGGPDGGDGGRGGHIYLEVDPNINTLLNFRYRFRFSAGDGGIGGKQRRHGANGEDLIIPVPPGTVVTTQIGNQEVSVDLIAPGQRLLAARGGKGGLGNTHFVSSANQAPKIAELGEPGEERTLRLDLKLIADVGLIGFPNAGKSTLLSSISAARPKIANYPFTTLAPNLGVVAVGDFSFVVADIPGLIEGAHQGVGLGHDFLRHVERTRLLIHVIDAAGTEGRDPLEDFYVINRELQEYSATLAERPQLVALNKLDLPEAQEQVERLRRELGVPAELIFPISAATGEGTATLMQRAAALLHEIPDPLRNLPVSQDVLRFPEAISNDNAFTIEQEAQGFRVRGPRIERLVAMTNFAQPEALLRLQRVLAASGISKALEQAGIEIGDMVYIGEAELEWTEESGV